MKVLVSGASGLIGRPLCAALTEAGHSVCRLVRRRAAAADEAAWDPVTGLVPGEVIEAADAVVNLAGENVGQRWTAGRREAILRSRIEGTRTLVEAINRARRKPAVLVNASAIGCYGDRGDHEVTESTPYGRGFLAAVCAAWEAEAGQAERFGVRVAVARFGIVLAPEGGALRQMLPAFRAGVGGPLGPGTQWMSWIHRDDAVAALLRTLEEPTWAGPLNVVAPHPVRNIGFSRVLGRVLHRPALLPVPAWVLRLLFGGMADEALLASTRAVPERLLALGHRFRHPELEAALAATLRKPV